MENNPRIPQEIKDRMLTLWNIIEQRQQSSCSYCGDIWDSQLGISQGIPGKRLEMYLVVTAGDSAPGIESIEATDVVGCPTVYQRWPQIPTSWKHLAESRGHSCSSREVSCYCKISWHLDPMPECAMQTKLPAPWEH